MEKTTFIEKIKKNIFVFIFMILAVVASATIYYTVRNLAPTVPVVVAADNIRVGEILEEGVLEIKYFSPSSVPESAFSTTRDLTGAAVINGPIVYGDIIRYEHLSTSGSLKTMLHTFTPEGWHAIELPSGIGLGLQGLKKGDYIQVYGDTFTEEGLMAGIIVPNAIILSVAGYDLGENNHIIAVPQNYVGVIADSIIKGKPMAIALPDAIPENIYLQKPREPGNVIDWQEESLEGSNS